jgi:hypothetical protein
MKIPQSVSLDPEVIEKIKAAASCRRESASKWLEDAALQRLENPKPIPIISPNHEKLKPKSKRRKRKKRLSKIIESASSLIAYLAIYVPVVAHAA